jgi:hypothetical protein
MGVTKQKLFEFFKKKNLDFTDQNSVHVVKDVLKVKDDVALEIFNDLFQEWTYNRPFPANAKWVKYVSDAEQNQKMRRHITDKLNKATKFSFKTFMTHNYSPYKDQPEKMIGTKTVNDWFKQYLELKNSGEKTCVRQWFEMI